MRCERLVVLIDLEYVILTHRTEEVLLILYVGDAHLVHLNLRAVENVFGVLISKPYDFTILYHVKILYYIHKIKHHHHYTKIIINIKVFPIIFNSKL